MCVFVGFAVYILQSVEISVYTLNNLTLSSILYVCVYFRDAALFYAIMYKINSSFYLISQNKSSGESCVLWFPF